MPVFPKIKFKSKKPRKNYLDVLPPEIALKILVKLSPSDLLQIATVNQRFMKLCDAKTLWKKKFNEAGLQGLFCVLGPRQTRHFHA